MAVNDKIKEILFPVAISLSSICIILSLISLTAAFNNTFWAELNILQGFLQDRGLAHQPQQQCWLCGMSHAFRMLWRGDISSALNYNFNSIWLFSVMIFGNILGFTLIVRNLIVNKINKIPLSVSAN